MEWRYFHFFFLLFESRFKFFLSIALTLIGLKCLQSSVYPLYPICKNPRLPLIGYIKDTRNPVLEKFLMKYVFTLHIQYFGKQLFLLSIYSSSKKEKEQNRSPSPRKERKIYRGQKKIISDIHSM